MASRKKYFLKYKKLDGTSKDEIKLQADEKNKN